MSLEMAPKGDDDEVEYEEDNEDYNESKAMNSKIFKK